MSKSKNAPSALPKGSGPGLAALGLAAVCLAAWGFNQAWERPRFEGAVQRAWLDGSLGLKEPGRIGFASGELSAQTVRDPSFGIVARAAVLERKVSTYQWVETCHGGGCSVSAQWSDGFADGKRFRTPGRLNPRPPHMGIAFATTAKVGPTVIGPSASRRLVDFGQPYSVGPHDAQIPGLFKVDGGYQNFQGQPKIGDYRVTWVMAPSGMAVTLAGVFGSHGEITANKRSNFLAREGAMSTEELLGLKFWELPIFGQAMLALCAALAGLGGFGLWSAKRIERQIHERRANAANDRRKKQIALPPGQPDRRQGERRAAPRALAKPRDKARPEGSQES